MSRRIACAAAGLILFLSTPVSAQISSTSTDFSVATVTDDRIDRVQQWLEAVSLHEPGGMDDASQAIESWRAGDLQPFWIDLKNLMALMRNPRASRFEFVPTGQRRPMLVAYRTTQLARMRALACGAAGLLAEHPTCLELKAARSMTPALAALAQRASESRLRGDPNETIRRGALLHADIAMSGPLAHVAGDDRPMVGPQSFLMRSSDGQALDTSQTAIHWELGRLLLDDVRPGDSPRPAPSSDAMVRLWYRATGAWMQGEEYLDLSHVAHGRRIFPRDADILFLLGCLHETFADAEIQSVMRSRSSVPSNVTMDVLGEPMELKLAEDNLRAAVGARPDFPEAHLRLGRIVALRGRYDEGAAELRRALQSLADSDPLRYFAELFLGAAEAGAGRYDAARAAYDRAAALAPSAQSPLLGLSELARRRGDRRAALAAMERLFALTDLFRDDPWWTYHVVQARDADALLDELWRPFKAGTR